MINTVASVTLRVQGNGIVVREGYSHKSGQGECNSDIGVGICLKLCTRSCSNRPVVPIAM